MRRSVQCDNVHWPGRMRRTLCATVPTDTGESRRLAALPFPSLPERYHLMHQIRALSVLVLTALLLSACGGGNSGTAVVDADPVRGQLLQKPPELVSVVTAPALLLALNALANQQLLAIGGQSVCAVAVHRIRYATVGGANEATTASGAMMVPFGSDPLCRGARPILLYAHGTTTDRAFDMTKLQGDPNGEALIMAALFAALGYIVIAPDYAGYGSSTLPYHPYLIADQQSKDMIDALIRGHASSSRGRGHYTARGPCPVTSA